MPDNFTIPKLTQTQNPPVSFHFMVSFLMEGVESNPLDIRFQKVSGISAEIETTAITEGGENIYMHTLPNRVKYGNLTLERGLVINSPLSVEFNTAMSSLRFSPSNVLAILLNENSLPLASWLFQQAYPVKWALSDLDAEKNSVAITTMELAYARFQSMEI